MQKIGLLGPIHEDGLKILKNSNFKILEITDYSESNLIENLKDTIAIAMRTAQLSKEVLQECKNLKIISRHGVGYDNVDINFLNNNNIALAITGTSNAVSVAEHVMSMFLSLCKLSRLSDNLVRTGRFSENRTMPGFFEIYKKNIFIIGFGRIGRELAKRCIAFDSKVFVYDPFVKLELIKNNGCFPIDFQEGLKIADFISIHVPLNKTTKFLISKNELIKMKKTCILVNTARGGIINEKDLLYALKNNIIFAAGLDVFETEPPNSNDPLFKLNNIILSPHNAALTLECQKRMGVETCNNIVNFLINKKELNNNNIVNINNINL